MSKPNIVVMDCVTGKQTVREMTDTEYEQYLADLETAETE